MRDGGYCLKTTGGPLTRLPLRSTVTSTRSAILMKGMPLFIPYCLRSKAIVPLIVPEPVPLPVIVKGQPLWLGHSANGEITVERQTVSGPDLFHLRRVEGDQGILFDIEEIFALQFAILHAASRINAGRLNLDVQNAVWTVQGT